MSFRISSVVGCIDDKHISIIIAPSEKETNHCMYGMEGYQMEG